VRRAALLALVLLAATGARAEFLPPLPPEPFLGVSTQTATTMPSLPAGEARTWPSALEVILVAPDAPGEKAEIHVGDYLLALDGQPFDPKDGDPATQLRRRVEKHAPGDVVTLTVLRKPVAIEREDEPLPEGSGLTLAPTVPWIEDVRVTLVANPNYLQGEGDSSYVREDSSIVASIARALTRRAGLEPQLDELERRLRRLAKEPLFYRPLDLLSAAKPSHDGTANHPLDLLWGIGDPTSKWPPFDPSVADPLGAWLEKVESIFQEAARLRALAFATYSDEENQFLRDNIAGLPPAIASGTYLHEDADHARARANRRIVRLAGRIDEIALSRAIRPLDGLVDRRALTALRDALRALPNAADPILARRKTPFGEIVVGGTGPNVWRDEEPAVIIDIGGDDIYANNAGSSFFDVRPVAAVFDLGGDDSYEGTDSFVQGCGIGGVGMLVDLDGNDRYLAHDGAQGVGILGWGILVDFAGDDRYRALHFAQGVGAWGRGELLDVAGNDSYEALSHAQGLGLPLGDGVLHDFGGNDRYFAKGGEKTGYGTQGVYDAWSQGCGFGLRWLAPGGNGSLVDDSGADDYEAGNFAQGGGYFFGYGILEDHGTDDDHYVGSRYNMGWAAHQACGAFLEHGGNDTYVTHHAVICGLAWDESLAVFRDYGGDDTYRTGFFSLGASAHNGIATFIDDDGSDTYAGAKVAQAGGNEYHGGTCLSLFLDLGRGQDTYVEGDAPAPLAVNGEHGFALDLPGRLDDWSDAAKLNAWLDHPVGRAPAGRPASARRRGLGR
jgi:hypothetical protein